MDNQNSYFYVVDEWKKLRDPHARCERFIGRTVVVDNLEGFFLVCALISGSIARFIKMSESAVFFFIN